ncbi:speckle-type POZ protein-like [Planococcus citri]|uniref:speckle-type POZ protein-like n=1 Tax=Planococcus citri TaxID=170843 RepID=UPI0031F8FAC5
MSNYIEKAENKGINDYSKFDEKNCTYTWIIDNYRARGDNFQSPAFTADGDDFKWRLEHRISRTRIPSSVIIYLRPDSDADYKKYSSVSGNLSVSVITGKLRLEFEYSSPDQSSFELISNETEKNRSPEFNFGDLSMILKLLQNDEMHVVCELKYSKTINTTSHDNSAFESSLSRDLERIRIDEDFSDVTISVDGKNYPAHKLILAARSSVFKAMFKNDMRESQKNHITITDMEKETFEEMLHYIYSGKVRNLEKSAFELLLVADKYDLEELKNACERLLITKISAENVGKILVLADMHNAEELKGRALRFIKENPANFETEIWNVLTESRPGLMKDILAMFLKK